MRTVSSNASFHSSDQRSAYSFKYSGGVSYGLECIHGLHLWNIFIIIYDEFLNSRIEFFLLESTVFFFEVIIESSNPCKQKFEPTCKIINPIAIYIQATR